ncbi:universal stress protein [Cupriavidus plantarum]|uniref:universal stress protein n=1 Tax=Cupriavidus plantarum TaxID=942865 RepID=UPI000EAE9188|nr:universal stress protein [Cupriavidus plantarum]RLK45650.1 nucleotide-binding universal stress UspA family protein [Cupriavidus plantarum]
MSFAAMLVHVDEAEGTSARLTQAVALAEGFHAALIGLLSVGANESAWVYRHADGRRERQAPERSVAEACEQARHSFDTATETATFPVDWRVGEGAPEEAMLCEGRLADLLIVGQPRAIREDSGMMFRAQRRFVASVILGAGRPVLVLPRDARVSTNGTRVVVGWNGSRESARALHDALPWLTRAESVDVVQVLQARRHQRFEASPGSYAVAWLSRHGIHAALTELVTEASAEVGALLLNFAHRRGADLIVCGAYGQGRLREDILGGVTDTLLRHTQVATLLAH